MTERKWLAPLFGAIAILLHLTPNVSAQSVQQFTGHASDASGAAIPLATITVKNESTGELNVQRTSRDGDFSVPYLKPGAYTISAEKPGFQTVVKEHISLQVDQTSIVDFKLPLGSVTQEVVINASALQIEGSKADRGEIIEAERIQQLPLDGLNPLKLFNLSPGTLDTGKPIYPRPFDNVNQNQYANGSNQTVASNLDGATNDNQKNFNGFVPPLDSVQELKVVLNPYDAQYGRSGGGAVDISLKSGTNAIHGDVYEYLRRRWLDANTWQNNYNGIVRPDHKRDQYGFELDGPVVIPKLYNGHDKTFFLIQYENMTEALPSTSATVNSLPDAAWLKGDFSNATYFNPTSGKLEPLTIYDPLTPLHSFVDPRDGKTKQAHDPFPGNRIPADRMGATGAAFASIYADLKPNATPGPGFAPYQNNFYWLPIEHDIWHSALVKIDHNLTANDRVTMRWGWQQRFTQKNNTGIPDASPASDLLNQAQPKAHVASLEEIHTFSPRTILDNRISMQTVVNATLRGRWGDGIQDFLGLSQHYVNNISFPNHFPYVTVKGFLGFGESSIGNGQNSHTLAYQPSLTHIAGRHTIRIGLDARWQQYANPVNGASDTFGFTNGWTQHYYNSAEAPGVTSGNSIASMLLGYMDNGSDTNPVEPFYSQHYYALWVQDDFKLTPKLTLNLGLRYDILGPRTDRFNRLNYTFNGTAVNPVNSQITNPALLNGKQVLGGIEFAGVNGNPRGAFATNYGDIQPRAGIAYAIDAKTSVRAGFGMMYINTEATNSNVGFSATTNYTNSLDNGVTPYGHLSDPFSSFVKPTGSSLGYLTGLGGSFSFTNPNYRIPRLLQYSVSVQRALSSRDVIDLSYSGTTTQNLDGSDNINHISPTLQASCDIERGGNRQVCDSTATGQVNSPFYQVPAFSGTSYYSTKTISTQNMSRPFPAFGDITENQENLVHTWYNSLQFTYSHQLAKRLTFHVAYTHSKAMQEGSWADTINRIRNRSISANDTPNQLSISGVWNLPLGRGQYLFGKANRLLDSAIGGWVFAPIYVYTQGFPWVPSGNWEQLEPGISQSEHDLAPDSLHAYTRIRGVTPCVGYKDTDTGKVILGAAAVAANCSSAKMVLAPNGYAVAHPVVYWGVRIPSYHQFDASLSKTFSVYERLHLQLRMDAINVLNHPIWQNDYNSSANDLNFGTQQKGPQGPQSVPRELQLSAKLRW
jgi:hypothetical protein